MTRGAPLILALAALAVYVNSFGVPFLFDDAPSIVSNARLDSPWPPWKFLAGGWSEDVTVAGRPVAEASLALDRAIGGLDPRVFHATNLLIHVLAGLALYGIVRRTLRLERFAGRFERSADAVAFATALLWLVHPLQTESVTYVVQRVESLAGLFVLLALYAAIRAATSDRRRAWTAGAIAACALGVGAKETAVAAPLLVLLHDRTFLAGSFRAALRLRRSLYAGLFASWILLLALVLAGPRLRVAGASAQSLSPLEYLSAQGPALQRYLRLALWPSGLVFDYGVARAGAPIPEHGEWIPGALVALAILAASIAGLSRGRTWGFLGACFLLLLAPSSSLVPIRLEVVAEHRLYLALAAVAAAFGLAAARLGPRALLATALVAALPLGLATRARNRDYASDVSIWSDTVAKVPDNARALTNLGLALHAHGDPEGALERHRQATIASPDYAEGWNNLSIELAAAGRAAEAEAPARRVVALEPQDPRGRLQLGVLLETLGRREEALAEIDRAAALDPRDPRIENQAGIALAELGRFAEAAARFRRALAIDPRHAGARANLERALAATAQPAGGGR